MKENKSMRNRMNTLLSISAISLFTWAGGYAFAQSEQEAGKKAGEAAQPAATAEVKDAIVATVNGVDITRSTLNAVIEMAKRSRNGAQMDERNLLDDLILTELARQEAKKSGLEERDDVKRKVENFADQLILNTWMQEKASSLEIADADLKEAYDKLVANMPKTEYKARHILLKTKEDAESVIETLNGGQDFAETAKKQSTGPSAPMGGDLGWFKPQSMVKPFADAVTSMDANSVSKTPVETQFGFHVIKLEEKRDVKLPDLDNMKPQLKRQLEQEKMRAYMTALQDQAAVKIMLPEASAEATEKAAEKTEAKTADKAAETMDAKPDTKEKKEAKPAAETAE